MEAILMHCLAVVDYFTRQLKNTPPKGRLSVLEDP